MKNIEKIKFISGLTLVSFAILGGLIFYLESFKILDEILSGGNQSQIWEDGYGDGAGASNSPIFLGLCGLAGAFLLSSVKPMKIEEKDETNVNED
jgi:hypothetical protein